MAPESRILVLLLCLIVSGQVSAADAEETFANAEKYTVRIDSTISRPFVEDDKGAFIGAGFMVDTKRRWVMTNAHVVGHSPASLEVITESGSRVVARKVYVDPYVDVAVIELEENNLPIGEATLGCNLSPGTGHPVGAYGHPWGFNFTGTQGVISGSIDIFGAELLQTDTPINGGNSGGPLISMKTGEVVGINTSSYSGDGDQNTNFAVPISQACRILQLLQDGRDPSPPQLNVNFYDTIGDNDPLVVARSFLREDLLRLTSGDEIVSANETEVMSESELVESLRGRLDDVRLVVRRGDQVVKLKGKLEPRPSITSRRGLYFVGLLFGDAGFRDASMLGLGHDVMVQSVEPGSQADSSLLIGYDYVASVNDIPIRDLDHLSEVLGSVVSSAHNEVTIDFVRFVEDGDTEQLFLSLRRTFRWSEPEYVGAWNQKDIERLQAKE